MEIKTIVIGDIFQCYCDDAGAEFKINIDINTAKVDSVGVGDLTIANLIAATKKAKKLFVNYLIDTKSESFFD
ncbi:hypothetical protein Spock_133 [Bacillus phage Spock]|uniref:Uncharacterized protein n=2 Tax=Bequatrovirus spock TaxID=1918008 RepID=A0A1X9SFZ2_9CAUD|nr:hypothetical protein Spock_133 [Bacillus phage Spock]AGY48533.1 hypothetical protein Spock_133 [Bacillus phage Spock]ARQ95045.1 hypothetical protein FLAPJACK_134 [Bacillus phage Flapjack]